MLADWFAESLKGGSWVMGDVTADVINNENKSGKEQWVEWRGCVVVAERKMLNIT